MTTETAPAQGQDASTAFLRAARAGHIDKIIALLEQGVDINVSNANGLNAIHLASKDGHADVVRVLLSKGAAIDAATKKGNTALHIASLAGQEPVVKLLVANGAQVNIQSQNGFTPLYMAAQENHDAVVKFLLANGANQSLATEDGFTPLAVAMQQGHEKVVSVLLEADTRGRVRLPALHIAAKKDDVKAANLLLENEHNPDVTSKSGFTPLHIAAHYGNAAVARLLLARGADVNCQAKHNICPLHVAAKWGKDNMVQLLCENGANVEARTRDGLTPLHCAARSGHERVVEALLEKGAPITSKSKNGLAPLHMAAQGEHAEAARVLLARRAPVDDVTVDYLTALHVAAHCGHAKVAKLLLDRNADANARALNGFTPLHIACKKNRIKVVELLLKYGATIQATTESGLTPLHVAAFMGCMNIVIYLLQHEANPDVPTVRGETPLHLAARANQTDIIRILLRNGAAVEAKAREKQTPLHIASRLGNVDIAVLLLQHGADVRAVTADHYNALHIAAKQHNHDVAASLIEHGAPLTAATKKGFTPLHLAAKYGNLKVANLLLSAGATADHAGKNGVTPLHVAAQYDQHAVATTLLENGADAKAVAKNGHTPLHIAARKNQMETAATLLEYGAVASADSRAGFTPLHLAAQQGHVEMCSLLLEHGAEVNRQAKNGLSALHLAAQEDRAPVARLLAKHGAEVDICTKGGYTPLHVASHYGQGSTVRYLIESGASVKAQTSHGYTALHHAAQQGHINIVNILLEHEADANVTTTAGQTPLDIASKLGYVTVMETLKTVSQPPAPASADKYRVLAPETMHETFISDSEEEGGELEGEEVMNDQPYRYLTADDMRSLGDDSLPIDVTRDERAESALGHKSIMEVSTESGDYQQDIVVKAVKRYSAANAPEGYCYNVDPTQPKKKLQWKNFLVSFLVDARGGALRGCRGGGVRVIVPPTCAPQPTRITCRYLKPSRINHMPPLMEGEALAARVLEMGPVSAKFLGPVIIEVPHFASLRGKEREIVVLRSDNGSSWREHGADAADDVVQDILHETLEIEESNEEAPGSQNPRMTRILTHDFPQYFAVISRIRQEVHAIGPEGGMVSSSVVPQVQAVFPQGALTKKIKVGLQAQIIDSELTAKLLGRGVAVSPVVTVEPRRRKFHKAITLSMPAPRPHTQGMTNQYSTSSAPTLRLLCSISGGTNRAHWEDVTENTPLTFVNDCVSFTTTVSARYWLIDCRHVDDATKMATELYREAIHVPFMARFIVYARRTDGEHAQLRMFCVTDDKEDKTLEKIERYSQVAKSRDVEVHEGKSCYLEFAGNLIPIAKSGEQLAIPFRAFRENRLAFPVMVKSAHTDAVTRCQFMREPKAPKGEPSPPPICVLNVAIPEEAASPAERSPTPALQRSAQQETLWRQRLDDPSLEDICNLLGKDWVAVAYELGVGVATVNQIQAKRLTSAEQAQLMLKLWKSQSGTKAPDNSLELALCRIGRDDIIAPQSDVINERRIQRNIYQERQASEEIEAYKAEEDNKLREMRELEDYERKDKINEAEIDDEAKYSPEEKSVYEKSEIERTPTPSEGSDEDEDVKRSVAERKEQITRKLATVKIPASKQKKEIREEIIEIRTQIKPDIKKFHSIEKQVIESKQERSRSKTSPESFDDDTSNELENQQQIVVEKREVSKTEDKPDPFKKFDPSSPAKPTPKHLQRHMRNDSMRFPSGDFSNITITPRKSITAETTDVKVTEKYSETTVTKEIISQKEIHSSQVEEKFEDGEQSPDLVMETAHDIAEASLREKISSFESKIVQDSTEANESQVRLTKEILKKHTKEHEVMEQEIYNQSEKIDGKIRKEDKPRSKTYCPSHRTDSTLAHVSSEEDNEVTRHPSTDSETESQTTVKIDKGDAATKDIKTKIKAFENRIDLSKDSQDDVSKDTRDKNGDDDKQDDGCDYKKIHVSVEETTQDLKSKVIKGELKEFTEENNISTSVNLEEAKVEANISLASTQSDASKHIKTDSVGSDFQRISQESPIANTDSLADLPPSTERDVSLLSQTDSKVYSKESPKLRSDSLDEASQFSDLDDQLISSPAHNPAADISTENEGNNSNAILATSETASKLHTVEFLQFETEYSAQMQAPSIPLREYEKVALKESPVISAKARQFIETVPEDDSVQECFFSKRIYSDSLEDSEHTDSRRHSEADSLKSDQSDIKVKVSSSDFDERAEYEETADSGSGFGDEKFEESLAFTTTKRESTEDSADKIIEKAGESSDTVFKKMTPKRHSRGESMSITKLSDLQLDADLQSKQEFQMVITEAEDIDHSFERDEPSDKISSESSREIEISERKSSEGVSDKISSEDAVTEKKSSSEDEIVRDLSDKERGDKILSSATGAIKDGVPVELRYPGTKDECFDQVAKRQSVTSASSGELRLEEKRLSDAHSLTESRDYTFEESEDDIGPHVESSKDRTDKTKTVSGKQMETSKLTRFVHGDSLDDVEGFPEDHVMEHVHKLPNIAEIGSSIDKDVTNEFLVRERGEQIISEQTHEEVMNKHEVSKSKTSEVKFALSTETETSHTTPKREGSSFATESGIMKAATYEDQTDINVESTSKSETKFDIKKIRADTLSKFTDLPSKESKKQKFVPQNLDLKETTEITKEQVKPVIDDIIQKGSIAAAARSPVTEKDVKSPKDLTESEKRTYDAKVPQKEERRHSCISPAISLERIAESDVETDEETPMPKPVVATSSSTTTELKKSDSAMKQMADNIEIIIKQASEEVDLSIDEPLGEQQEATTKQDIANKVSVDSIIEEAVNTVEEYLDSAKQSSDKEIEMKKEMVYEETKKFAKDRPSLIKSLSRDSGEIVILPKKKQPRTFSVQSSPDEVEEQIYTDSESDMDKAKVLEIIEPSLEEKAATGFDTRKLRTDSLDDADELFQEKEGDYDGDYSKGSASPEKKQIKSETYFSTEIEEENTSEASKRHKFEFSQSNIVSKSTTESTITTVISTLTDEDKKSIVDDGTSGDWSKISGAELVKDSSRTSVDIKEESRFDELDRGTPEFSKKSIELMKDYSKSSIDSKDTSRDFASNELSKDSTIDLTKDCSKASIDSVRDISKSIDEKTISQSSFDVSKTLASEISEPKYEMGHDVSHSHFTDAQEVITTSTETGKTEISETSADDKQDGEVPDISELNRRCSNLLEDISQGALIKIDASHITNDYISKFSKTPPPSPVDLINKEKHAAENVAGDKQTGLQQKGSDSSFLDTSRHSPRASSAGDSMISETEAHHSETSDIPSTEQSVSARSKSPTRHLADNSTVSFVNVDQPTITSGAKELVDRTIEKSIDVIEEIKKEKLAAQIEDIKKTTSDVFFAESRVESSTSTSAVQKIIEGSELKFESIDPTAMMSDMVAKFSNTGQFATVLSQTETETKKISGHESFSQTKQISTSDDDSLVIKMETSHELRGQEHEIKQKSVVFKDGDVTESSQNKLEKAHEGMAKRVDIETKTLYKSNDDSDIVKVEREFLEQGLYAGRQTKSEEKMTSLRDEVKKEREIKISERDLSHEQWGKEYFTEPGELEDITEDEEIKSKSAFVDSSIKIVEKDEVVSTIEVSEKGKVVSSKVEHHKEESIIESKDHDDISSDASHATSFKSETADQKDSSELSPKSKSKSFKKENEVYEVDFIKEIKISTSPVKSSFSRSASHDSNSESEAAPDLPHDDTPKKDKPKSPVKLPLRPIEDQVLEVTIQKTGQPILRAVSETTNQSSDSDTVVEIRKLQISDTATKLGKTDLSPSTFEMSDDFSTTSKDFMVKSGESIDTEYMIKSLESHEGEVLQKSMDSTVSAETLHASEFSTEADSAFLTGTDHKREELKLVKEKSLEDICSSGYDTDLSSAEFHASKLESERMDFETLKSVQPLADLSVLEKTIDEVKQSLEAAQGEIISEKNDGSSKYKQSPSEFQFKLLVSPDRPEVITEEPQVSDDHGEKSFAKTESSSQVLDSFISDSSSYKVSSQEETSVTDEDTRKEMIVQHKESSPGPCDSGDISLKSDSGPHSILETESEIILSERDSSKSSPEVKLRVQKHIQSKLGVGERRSASEVEGWSSSGGSHYESFEHSDSRPLSSDVEVMMTAQSGTEFETALTSHDISSHSMRTSKDYFTAASSLASRDSMKSLDSDASSHVASIDISDASETLVPSAHELREELMESSTYVEHFLHEGEKEQMLKTRVSEDDLSADDDERKDQDVTPVGKMKRSHEMRFQPKDLIPENFPIESASESLDIEDNSTKDKYGTETTVASQFKSDEYRSSPISNEELSSSNFEHESNKYDVKENVKTVSTSSQQATPFTITKGPKSQREFVDIENEIIPVGSEEYEKIVKTGSVLMEPTKPINEEVTIVKKSVDNISITPSETSKLTHHIEPVEVQEECYKKNFTEVSAIPFPIVEKPLRQREFVDIEDQIIDEKSLQYEEILKSKSDSSVPKTKTEKSIVQSGESQLESKQSSTSSLKTQDHISTPHTPLSAPSQSSLSTDNGKEYVLEDIYDISEAPELKSDLLTEETTSRSELMITTDDHTIVEKEQESPTSDEFEMVDKPSEMDDFVVIEEVAREAQESDAEGKSIRIKSQVYIKKHDTEIEEMLSKASKKQESTSSASTSLSDEELLQYELEQKRQAQELVEVEAGKRWVQMQFEGDPRYDYERVPLEDIKEEEMTDFDASRIGSLSSQKESVGSFGSFKNSYGSISESEMASRIRFRVKGDNDDVSISSLQEFENLERALMEQYQQHSSSSQDSLNGSLPRRYVLSKSQGDDISISSLKEFEGLESACLEALKAELIAKQKEALLSADPKIVTGCFLEEEKRWYCGSREGTTESSPPQKSGSPSQKSGSPPQKGGSPSQKNGSPLQKVGSLGSPAQKLLSDSATIRKLIDQQMALEEKLREQTTPMVTKVTVVKKFDDRGAFFVAETQTEPSSAESEIIEEVCQKSSNFVCADAPKKGSAESIPGDCEAMMKMLDQEEKGITRSITEGGVVEVIKTTTVTQEHFVDGNKVSEPTQILGSGVDIPAAKRQEFDIGSSVSYGSEMSTSVASQQSDMDSLMTIVEKVTDSPLPKQSSGEKPDDLELVRGDSITRELSPSSVQSATHSISGKQFTDPASGSWSGQDEELSSSGSFSRVHRADLMLGSTDSLEATSSNATRATYNYEVDTPMTGSLTSGGSNTMVSSLDTLDPVTAVHVESLEHPSTSEHYSRDYEVQEPDSDTERLELDGRAPRAKERTIMFDSTDTLSAVSGDGSVREAAVEGPAAMFYIGDTPLVRGETEDTEADNQPLSGSCPASLPPPPQPSPPVPAQRRSLSMLAKSPPSSLEGTPKK